jgi:Pyruvate/2-oxoacid:ferredoxin oxidoreductase gamma subunit
MVGIKFYGRGGQGVVVTARILAGAYFLMGRYPQYFALFGRERRGAPVASFLRTAAKVDENVTAVREAYELTWIVPAGRSQ